MSGGKYRVHPKFGEYGAFGLVEWHTMATCDEVCGCGQVTCPCMEGATCHERNYYCCDGRMPLPANCLSRHVRNGVPE